MPDELISALFQEIDVRAVCVTTRDLTRFAASLARLAPASGAFLAQGLSAVSLLAALQKDGSRVNLQIECDGPLRGMFCDGTSGGTVRGYVKNPNVQLSGDTGAFHWRPVLGNRGFVSVLRDLGGGEQYRSAVALEAFELGRDLEHYFTTSDQIASRLFLADPTHGGFDRSGGLLLQCLPNGDVSQLHAIADGIAQRGDWASVLASHAGNVSAALQELAPRDDLEVLARYRVAYGCGCSSDRVKRALLAMGRAELEDLLAKEGKAEATCQFCSERYEISGDEIRALLSDAGR